MSRGGGSERPMLLRFWAGPQDGLEIGAPDAPLEFYFPVAVDVAVFAANDEAPTPVLDYGLEVYRRERWYPRWADYRADYRYVGRR